MIRKSKRKHGPTAQMWRSPLYLRMRQLAAGKGGQGRARALSAERRREIAQSGWEAKLELRAQRIIEAVLFEEQGLVGLLRKPARHAK